MLTFRELAKSLSALLALSAVSACDGWPPRSDDLVTHIKEHKGQIETLVSEFRNSEFGRITCHLCTWEDVEVDDFTVSRKFVDGLWRSVENPRGQYFAELLKAAGVGGVYKRSGGEIELSIAVSARVDDRHYVIQIFHDQQQRDDGFKECIGEFKKIDCGWCKVTVDENLWIQYG